MCMSVCVPINSPLDKKYNLSSQPNPDSVIISLFLLTPNEVDCMTPANQILSIFLLFFVLYPTKLLAFHPIFIVLQKYTVHFMNCFFNHFLTVFGDEYGI